MAGIKGLSLHGRHLRVKVKALTSANVPEKKRENRCEADPLNNHHLQLQLVKVITLCIIQIL